MRVKKLRTHERYIEYEALQEGVILTNSGDHPGPQNMKIHVNTGQKFILKKSYISRNDLTVVEIHESILEALDNGYTFPEGVSHSVDLDQVAIIAKVNPSNAITMLIAYNKLRDGHIHMIRRYQKGKKRAT